MEVFGPTSKKRIAEDELTRKPGAQCILYGNIQRWAIRWALGCVNSCPRPEGDRRWDSRNLGTTLLPSPVVKISADSSFFPAETRVLLGSGMSDYAFGYTEIYHLKNQSVTLGPQMPFGPLHGAYSYPFGDTFVVTGGSKPLEGDAESTGKTKSLQC